MLYTFDENIISDLYKEVNGFRPSQYWWGEWMCASSDKKQKMWNCLIEENDVEIERDRKNKCAAEGRFGDIITKNMKLGAEDKITAIRWIIQSENISNYNLMYGPEYVSYHFGMSYNTMWKSDIQSAIESMEIDFNDIYDY